LKSLPYEAGGILMPFNDELHLSVIMNDPCQQKLCLIARITTVYPQRYHDPSCLLYAGDHPFLKHTSYVVYSKSTQVRCAHIKNMLAKRYFITKEDFSPAIFKRVADGLYASEETPQWALDYAEAVGI
jgi:hypothetical protein